MKVIGGLLDWMFVIQGGTFGHYFSWLVGYSC